MQGEPRVGEPAYVALADPDEWDLDVRLGELGTVLCGCGDHNLADFAPTRGGGTCDTSNDTCPNTCAGPTCADTCAATCPDTCGATCPDTCQACGPTDFGSCNSTHCFTCLSGCQTP